MVTRWFRSLLPISLLVGLLASLLIAQPASAAPGDLDPTFGSGGVVTTAIGSLDEASAVAIQADGKIVAAGYTSNGPNTDFGLARSTTSRTLDPTVPPGG